MIEITIEYHFILIFDLVLIAKLLQNILIN